MKCSDRNIDINSMSQRGDAMIGAIIILVLLGLLDLMLFVACVELEKERKDDE